MTCDHCGRALHPEDYGVMQVAVIPAYAAALGVEDPVGHTLCGLCSFELGEFLCPELHGSASWLLHTTEIRAKMRELYGITD